ncbi:MAG TPA: hypothetical protein PKN48_00940 [Bacteroidales bacterium]|nr:hypothetical protein [Bacteroidales bacterium]
MNKAQIVFEKLALSPELLERASVKAFDKAYTYSELARAAHLDGDLVQKKLFKGLENKFTNKSIKFDTAAFKKGLAEPSAEAMALSKRILSKFSKDDLDLLSRLI